MADETNAAATATATGDGGKTGEAAGNERDAWTAQDWERHVQREADRRVTDALKKSEEKYTALLADTKTTAEQKLNEYQTQLAQERARAEFLGAATQKGVNDVRAAWAVAREFGYLSGDKVNWDGMREAHPGLFLAPAKTTSAAAGAPDVGTRGSKPDMNRLIRQAAGYGG